MISPTEFYKILRNGSYRANIKIYQSQQTLDYNGAPMFEIEITIVKTRDPKPDDPYDAPYEFELTLKQNYRELHDFIVGVKLSNLRWKTAGEVDKVIIKLKQVIRDLIDDCKSYQGSEYNSNSEYYAYRTISGCYERLSLHFDRLRESYDAYIVRTES